MPRTKGVLREKECHINETVAKAYENYEDNIIQEIAKGGLDLPPYSDEEDETLMKEWTRARNEKERKIVCAKLWKGWHKRHNNEVVDWQPEDIKQLEYMLVDNEADGLSPTASGKEGEDLPGFSSGEFPSSIHPVEEEEAPAEAPWSLKELLEEDSFTISSIDQMEEEESVGVMPNISEDDGEMSAPTSSRVNREMSAPTVSRDNREMSALNIPIATWRDAIVGDCSLNIQTRERIIAEVLKPHFVVPPKGSREWELLDHVVMMERRRQDMIWRQSLLPEKRDEGLRKRLALDSFYKATKCGRLRAYSAPVRRHLLLHLLN